MSFLFDYWRRFCGNRIVSYSPKFPENDGVLSYPDSVYDLLMFVETLGAGSGSLFDIQDNLARVLSSLHMLMVV